MLKLVVCFCVLSACYGQDHLTCSCLKPAEIFTHPCSQTPLQTQGPPGKLGPKGEAGSRGLKGIKGEPGIPDNQQINLVRGKYQLLFFFVELLLLYQSLLRYRYAKLVKSKHSFDFQDFDFYSTKI